MINTENELFGKLHEQEENGLFGNEHRRQYEAQQEALRQSAVSGMLKCASCENTAKKDGLDCYGKCHICTQAF